MLQIRDICATTFCVLLSVAFYEKKSSHIMIATALRQINRKMATLLWYIRQMMPPLWEGATADYNLVNLIRFSARRSLQVRYPLASVGYS